MEIALGYALGQSDDTLKIQLFGQEDLNLEIGKNKSIIASTNRLAESSDDMAQQVIIIEGDEIRKFGYSTLVDVLKSIPGFRTSQPGNAIEGESFLMRGLYGNDHAKILINGLPIKPEAVPGMPIASQLPIRHAERIEIVLGPSSSSYGTDAMAGVINIVLPDVDRPVFAWADVNLITPKTTNINLTLGGKVGRGKNILNYEIFATSHRATDVNLLIPDDSIYVDPSSLTWSQQQLFFGKDGVPEVDDLIRESRLIGSYLKFRWFEVSAMNMYRNEHSGLGSNPLVQSYHEQGLTFGENINSFSLKYSDQKDKRYMSKAGLSALTYRTLSNSSYYGVENYLSNGKNFMYARSLDLYGEYTGILKISDRLKMAVGTTADYSISHPFTSYLGRPYRDESTSFNLPPENDWLITGSEQSAIVDSISLLDSLQFLERYTRYNIGGFLQFSYKSKTGKFNGEVGSRVDYNSFKDLVFTPRIGIVYRPINRLKVRAYYGTGYRAPRSFYIYNNYEESFLKVQNGQGLKRQKADILAEHLKGGELGIDWDVYKDLKLTAGYYVHYMNNKVMRQIYDTMPGPNDGTILPDQRIGVGFFNGDSYSLLQSIMLTAEYSKKFRKVGINLLVSYEYAKGKEVVEKVDNVPGEGVETPGYRYVPQHSAKGNLTLTAFDFTLTIRNTLLGHYVTEIYRVNRHVNYKESDKYFYNMDILLHKQLFRQLSVFGGVYNVFNSVQSGIPNVNLSGSWTFNPQYGRYFKVGLTFKLN